MSELERLYERRKIRPARIKNQIIEHADYAEIFLSENISTLIDKDKIEVIKNFKWFKMKSRSEWYVGTNVDGKIYKLARLLIDAKPGQFVDHINQKPLDNRICNLRITSPGLNNHNKKVRNKTGFRGVTISKNKSGSISYRASFRVNGRMKYLGMFSSARAAAIRVDEEAARIYGDNALLTVSGKGEL